jgi:hypothetical protein
MVHLAIFHLGKDLDGFMAGDIADSIGEELDLIGAIIKVSSTILCISKNF